MLDTMARSSGTLHAVAPTSRAWLWFGLRDHRLRDGVSEARGGGSAGQAATDLTAVKKLTRFAEESLQNGDLLHERHQVTVYVFAQLKLKNRPAYDRYQAGFGKVFSEFSGNVLAADRAPTVVEGDWKGDKVVLLSFPDDPSYFAWAESPGYREISKDRLAGADCTVLLFNGAGA